MGLPSLSFPSHWGPPLPFLSFLISSQGFCQSIEELYDRVEGTVLSRGGEVFTSERCPAAAGSLQQALRMTVALPLLWGVPPETARLRHGVAAGGGIIDRVFHEWHIY